MRKILLVFGTRPEAIKMAPIILKLKEVDFFETRVCVTAQHREMLDQILAVFNIIPDYDLNVMTKGQNLFDITANVLTGVKNILEQEQPDVTLVQGDTTTTFAASLAAYYLKIPVGHVEAGLRTYNKYSPYPEEKNRHMTSTLADIHFVPTVWAQKNLIRENIDEKNIHITGNTVIDALFYVLEKQKKSNVENEITKYFFGKYNFNVQKKFILVTGHRRESFGKDFENICMALKEISINNPNINIVYPVHLNPNVQKPVYDILKLNLSSDEGTNIYLMDPLDYEPFIFLMKKSYLILTDSGGIQEEAPSLGKPVLVMRDTTERPEGIEAGVAKLVGKKMENIIYETQKLIDNDREYKQMAYAVNPYGDGKASDRIANLLKERLEKNNG